MDEALGIVEVRGLTAIIEVADAMLKVANVTLIGYLKVGRSMISVTVRGEVEAVKVSVELGAETAARAGELVVAHVIPKPHPQVWNLVVAV